jgi:protocatechuate 3,4-dioxygenase beta subunit
MAVELLRSRNYLAAATTDAQGRYQFEGLVDNERYYVRVTDPTGLYATTYYSDEASLLYATGIAVSDGQDPPPADVRLPHGGAVSGRVVRAGGQPIARAQVSVYKVVGYLQFADAAAVVSADAAGVFHVRGLRPGQYRICAAANEPPRYGENCYGTPPSQSSIIVYTPVTITAGAERAGIAITLGPTPRSDLFLPTVHRAAGPGSAPGAAQPSSGSSPTARGSVAGSVHGPDGQPLAGIIVTLEQALAGGGWATMAVAESAAGGRYSIGQLAPGLYRVRFDDYAAVYAPQYYPEAIAPATAEVLNVNGNALRDIDAELMRGGALEGNILGAPYPYTGVSAYVQIDGAWQEVQSTYTPATPHFRFPNLPPATYRVCAPYINYHAGRGPCYGRSSDIAFATDVLLTAGAVMTGIDIAMAGLPDAAAITGAVYGLDGTPLGGIAVMASAAMGYSNGWQQVAVTRTNAAGEYRLADLAPAEYIISFFDPNGDYLPEVYAGVDSFAHAEPLALARFEERGGINARLKPAGVISGVVTLGGPHPAPPSRLEAYTCPDAIFRSSAMSDPLTGAYRIGGLPPGVYCVYAHVSSPAFGMHTVAYSEGPAGEPSPITVALGSRIGGIDIAVAADDFAGVITGTVTGEGGRALEGIHVELLSSGPTWDLPPRVYVLTGSDGSYRFDGLAQGLYSLRFVDPGGVYAPMYAENQRRPGDAQGWIISGKQPLGPIDTQMLRSGSVRGQVRNGAGAPAAGAIISFRLPRSGMPMYGDTITVVRSDGAGNYVSSPLPPGEYQICAEQYSGMDFQRACIGYEYGAQDPGLILPLRSGETQTLDFVFGFTPHFAYHLYLPTVDRALPFFASYP